MDKSELNLLARALPNATWAIGAVDGSDIIEVRPLKGVVDKFIVVICKTDGTVKQVRSKRGMAFERAKADAIWLAGAY